MDETQIFPTFRYSSTLGGADDPWQIPVSSATLSTSSTPTIPKCENFDRFEAEKRCPTMPATTVSRWVGESTVSYSATLTPTNTDTDNDTATPNQPMIRGNAFDECAVIIKQEQKIVDDEIENNHCFEFIRPYENDYRIQQSSFISGMNITTMNHQIHVNPSILLSKHRANYSGPGTPMPELSSDYNYSHQSSNCTNAIEMPPVARKKRKRSRKRICNNGKEISNDKTPSEIKEYFSSIRPKQFAKLLLKVQERNNSGSKRKKQCLRREMEMNPMFNNGKAEKVDARLWLNAKAKLIAQAQADITRSFSSSTSTIGTRQSYDSTPELSGQQYIDRATSPINFPRDEQTIKSKTRDIALSPIRFIEPQLKCFRSHPDVGLRINLSPASSQTIESANRTKILNCLLGSQHSCEKCIVMSRQMVDPICPICHAKNAGIVKKSI